MIDYQITQASTGKDKTYFFNHPASNKKVYVMCSGCGIFRWTEYRLSHKLCRNCSLKNHKLLNSHKQNISAGMNKNDSES